jgi:hypothetical protein
MTFSLAAKQNFFDEAAYTFLAALCSRLRFKGAVEAKFSALSRHCRYPKFFAPNFASTSLPLLK